MYMICVIIRLEKVSIVFLELLDVGFLEVIKMDVYGRGK